MKGYVAVTDPGWYGHLAETPGPKDANFWRPSTKALRLPRGTPFFFKLKAPHDAIAGYGYFWDFSVLPDWMAWETFGSANGVDGLHGLRERLRRIQRGAQIEPDPQGRIGCCLIADSVFFPRDAWVKRPADWSARTVKGKGYDLTSGEGRRVWLECQARFPRGLLAGVGQSVDVPRYGSPALTLPRLGQSIFRIAVLDAYERACAVSREHSLPVLEAAHIKPYATGGRHAVSNGIALRSDIHRLFDRGYVTIDESDRFVVSRRLKDDYDNGRSYERFHGQPITRPQTTELAPDQSAMAWHRNQVFLG